MYIGTTNNEHNNTTIINTTYTIPYNNNTRNTMTYTIINNNNSNTTNISS